LPRAGQDDIQHGGTLYKRINLMDEKSQDSQLKRVTCSRLAFHIKPRTNMVSRIQLPRLAFHDWLSTIGFPRVAFHDWLSDESVTNSASRQGPAASEREIEREGERERERERRRRSPVSKSAPLLVSYCVLIDWLLMLGAREDAPHPTLFWQSRCHRVRA
jgi:hypothetical protein